MSDHERGAYTPPTDGGLTFDARQPVRGGPAPLTLILSILVLAGIVAALFFFYRSGVRQAGQAPQPVGTPVGEMRTPPPPEAQPDDPASGLEIYRSDAGTAAGKAPNFVPPPEEPAVRAAPTAPVVVTTAPPAKVAEATPPPALRPALPTQAPAPKAAAAPPAKVVAPPPKPVQTAAAKPEPAPPKPVAAKPSPAKAEPATGGAVVQIGAVTTTALAEKAWKDAVALAPAGKGKSITKIDKDGATLYRTAVTGFASRADAQAFCAKLKAAGKSCFVR
jgi:hypothetical protein